MLDEAQGRHTGQAGLAGQTDHAYLPLATLKAMLTDADQRARAYEGAGRMEAATATYDTFLRLLYTLLADDPAPRQGWRSVALRLADERQRLPIDGLVAAQLDLCHLRITALSGLPPILSLKQIGEVAATLTAAISWGAPAYNAGAIRECGAIYWATQQTLLAAPPTPTLAGWSGYAYALAPLQALVEQSPSPTPLSAAACADFAWELRRSFDATLARMDQAGTSPLMQLPMEVRMASDATARGRSQQPVRRLAQAQQQPPYRGPLLGILPAYSTAETLPDQ